MPYSSGTYSMPSNSFAVPVTGTTISSSAASSTWSDLATALSTCVLKDGTQTITANIPMSSFKFTGLAAGSANGDSVRYEQLFTTSAVTLLGAMDWVKGADIASAATVNLTTATGNAVHITGTTTITAVTLGSGMWRLVIFDGALTLTHHATNNNLPGAANITTAANDRALYWSDGTTVYCVGYQTAASSPVGTVQTLTHKGLVDISASGAGQIKFPATQNASADANTLDDYEEGTWTPAFTFTTPGNLNIAYSTQAGSYTKIGRQVTCWFNLVTSTFTHTTASGSANIQGLPFASAATITNIGTLEWSGITLANYTYFVSSNSPSTSVLTIQASGSGQTSGPAMETAFPTGGTVVLRGCITYNV